MPHPALDIEYRDPVDDDEFEDDDEDDDAEDGDDDAPDEEEDDEDNGETWQVHAVTRCMCFLDFPGGTA